VRRGKKKVGAGVEAELKRRRTNEKAKRVNDETNCGKLLKEESEWKKDGKTKSQVQWGPEPGGCCWDCLKRGRTLETSLLG